MLSVENLRKQYAGFEGKPGGGVLGVSFTIAQGELFTLLGPSGCGKTTTLRAIAGLETPEAGLIRIGTREMFHSGTGVNVPLYDRDIGMVFQSYAIWPHMSVFENAAYPLRVSRGRRYAASEIQTKTMNALAMVGLADYAKRAATQLSGGQQQRLALARAFTREPKLLLLDEPLSNLDAQLREQMRVELKRLQQQTGVTAVYVTHDQAEALAMSDRVAVMHEGRIVQVGTPKEIYGRPQTEFVANFIGRTNLIKGATLRDVAADSVAPVGTAFGELLCFFPHACAAGRQISLVVRPEHIAVGNDAGSRDSNRLSGQVKRETYLGEIVEYVVDVSGGELLVRTQSGNAAKGDAVTLTFPAAQTVALVPT